ncbi:ATP-binding cassette domain-containing protein [Mucilaginibacter pallidiroseus]|uniref:ATP-binding cassette domain-containing protein n=1 Tax=Mucilaginibacter pallidiroseus TaxID=2599295 RepID=A0A563UJW6_9SPHI|nr:ATP-binding cassette domain-containing protein [Mucilaginibacter pallidiroseus]TWR31655.1 ATP-binding cassette domain-containing protein [Mucilaginibacter pallidiroseus]
MNQLKTSSVLNISNATVKSGQQILLNDVNFTINKGQHWAITGKSGSGKSVLLQVTAGNLALSAGNISYGFMQQITSMPNVTDIPLTHHQFVALVGPKHHFKNLSNTANLYYQQRYNSSDSEDALTVTDYLSAVTINHHSTPYWTIDKTIAALNLTELRDKQIIKLSNGETKRLMIAAALIKNPLLLLLDNPLTGLDVQMRERFNQLFKEIAQSGVSLVMVTSAGEIPEVITNVAILDTGSIKDSISRQDFVKIQRDEDLYNLTNTNLVANLMSNHIVAPYHDVVRMENVVIKYGAKTVLDNVNWHIGPGERWALLGPNGAGKSTLLSLINGDNPQAYANNIVLFDRKRGSGESIWDIKSKIGFVSPELYQYFPADTSCLQVIESGFYDTLGLFRPSSKPKADLALMWMQALEIDKYARVLLKNIPASAQRLCLLARALIKNPALLIFDEPCQGLDDHQQQNFKNIVDAICSISDVTLIYVTHYQHEIPTSVTQTLRLDGGKVVS